MSIPTDSGNITAETTADSPAAAAATAELVALLGERFVTDAAAVDQSRQDRSGWPALGSPLGIAEPETVEEVQGALRIAHRHGIPVVPRGAGTGLTGGAAGTDGAIVLSTMRMAAILEISPADELAVVQPGILNGDLNEALVEYGLRFSPDPASFAISSIGGNVATNAGGLRCAKYGVTRDKVLALDVVLADGSLLTVGHRSVKGVTGYDLTALFVGSEGTLGVIVSVTVRLDPIPAAGGAIIGAFFDGVRSAAAASAAVTAAKLRPVTMELMDRASLSAIDAWTGSSFLDEGSAYLLIQTDGSGALAEAEQALEIVVAAGGRATLSVDPVVAENLLAIRRKALPALESVGRVLIEDVSVPRSAMAAMFEAIDDISARYGITIATLAHAGDGNLHPNILLDRDVTEVPEHVWQAASEIFGTALTLGGTLTGEHGIGVLKKRWLGEELGELSFSLQQQIKAVFDPTGILNPGKVF